MKYITRFLLLVLVILGAIIFWVVSDQNGSTTTPPSTLPAPADPEAITEVEPESDRELPPEDAEPARNACREFLLQTLDAPEAAEFEDIAEWPLRQRSAGTLEVRMSGRIQDNLGEMIDAQWQCVVLPAGSQMRLVSLTILGAGDNDRREPESSGPDSYEPDTSAWESLTGTGDEPAPGADEDEQPADSSEALDPATGEDASDAAFPAPERQNDN